MPRELTRTPLIYHLRVLSGATDRIFGYLGNITTKGVLLYCPEEVNSNALHALKMSLPVPIEGATQIPFNAASVWCQWDQRLGMYAAGFRIESTDPQGSKLIANTITALGSKVQTLPENQVE